VTRALALLLALSCGKQAPAPDKPAVSSSQVEAQGDPGAMHTRLQALTIARDRLVAGDLPGAREQFQALADDAVPSLAPEAWRAPLEDLRDAAASGAEASSVAASAKAVAQGARACGACHGTMGGGPRWVAQPLPAPEALMARHVWASDRMWEGLIGPDPERWRVGTAALATEAGDSAALFSGIDLATASQASKLHSRLHELADAGDRAGLEPSDQVELYAAFVGACADCHSLLKRGPR
jgi:hypothetical protein